MSELEQTAEKLFWASIGYKPSPFNRARIPRLQDLWPNEQERHRQMAIAAFNQSDNGGEG